MKLGTIFKYNNKTNFVCKPKGIRKSEFMEGLEYYGENEVFVSKNEYGIVISPSKIDVDWFVFLDNKFGILREISMEILK